MHSTFKVENWQFRSSWSTFLHARNHNLNRFYLKPDIKEHPPVYAIQKIINSFDKKRLFLYLDIHAHASKRGCFLYGNWQKDETKLLEAMTFARVLSQNNSHVHFESCVFSKTLLNRTDRYQFFATLLR